MSEEHNMGHLNYLSIVAQKDVDFVVMREGTYQGSWKRSGGRSAWFMLKRKIDRLTTMLARPKPNAGVTLEIQLALEMKAEDVFENIKVDPSGKDGTVLAEIRDLRQYLLLVEAEMMSRGLVAKPGANAKPAPLEAGNRHAELGPNPVPLTDSNKHAEREKVFGGTRMPVEVVGLGDDR